jgi:hypothetical protein
MSIDALSVLIGTWHLTGRSVGAGHDNITGELTGRAILGGQVLELAGTMRIGGQAISSLELVWADEAAGDFAAHVYPPVAGAPLDYRWARSGATLTHAGLGATYTGTISDDGTTITGGWRADPGQPEHPGSSYDAIMRRVGAA